MMNRKSLVKAGTLQDQDVQDIPGAVISTELEARKRGDSIKRGTDPDWFYFPVQLETK